MRLLGAILAGGRSRRFGSDKALALYDGRALLDHVVDGLTAQVDALVVCGRDWAGLTRLDDRPAPDQGPLGGLCAALHHAAAHGFDAVLTAGCDVLPIPSDLRNRLWPGPAVVQGQPLFGLWPVNAPDLDRYLSDQPDRSMRGWIAHRGAQAVTIATRLHNLNTPADLAALHSPDGALR